MHINRMNYGYLLGGLMCLMLSMAIAQEKGITDETRRLFLEPALCLMLLMGIWNHVSEKIWLIAGGGILAVSGVATAIIDYFLDIPELQFVNMSILFVFSLASTWIASQHLLLSGAVSVNKIIGAICIYLLIGLNWAMFHLFTNIAIPDSYRGLTSTALGAQFSELMYFSFVTIAALGYGDLVAVKPLARTLAFLEAIIGQFYVAVLVAWLVGMYLSDKTQDRKQP